MIMLCTTHEILKLLSCIIIKIVFYIVVNIAELTISLSLYEHITTGLSCDLFAPGVWDIQIEYVYSGYRKERIDHTSTSCKLTIRTNKFQKQKWNCDFTERNEEFGTCAIPGAILTY